MSRISYYPVLDAGDGPSKSPDERFFVPSAGSAVFDIDSIYGGSDTGDFFQSNVNQYTDTGKTTPISSSGDLIANWSGGRTTGTAKSLAQGTAGSRPEAITDGTYGLVTRFIAGASKFLLQNGTVTGGLWGARVKLASITTGGSTVNGLALGGEDFGSMTQTMGIAADESYGYWAATYSPTKITDTNWHTMVVNFTGGNCNLYFDDMNTPVATTVDTADSLFRMILGQHSTSNDESHVYKFLVHSNGDAATPTQLASWLEA